jgi:hypothetical protein
MPSPPERLCPDHWRAFVSFSTEIAMLQVPHRSLSQEALDSLEACGPARAAVLTWSLRSRGDRSASLLNEPELLLFIDAARRDKNLVRAAGFRAQAPNIRGFVDGAALRRVLSPMDFASLRAGLLDTQKRPPLALPASLRWPAELDRWNRVAHDTGLYCMAQAMFPVDNPEHRFMERTFGELPLSWGRTATSDNRTASLAVLMATLQAAEPT